MTYQENVRAAINHAQAEDMHKQRMEQLRQSRAEPTGWVVVRIEKNASFTPNMPDYPKKSIREFARLMMSR